MSVETIQVPIKYCPLISANEVGQINVLENSQHLVDIMRKNLDENEVPRIVVISINGFSTEEKTLTNILLEYFHNIRKWKKSLRKFGVPVQDIQKERSEDGLPYNRDFNNVIVYVIPELYKVLQPNGPKFIMILQWADQIVSTGEQYSKILECLKQKIQNWASLVVEIKYEVR